MAQKVRFSHRQQQEHLRHALNILRTVVFLRRRQVRVRREGAIEVVRVDEARLHLVEDGRAAAEAGDDEAGDNPRAMRHPPHRAYERRGVAEADAEAEQHAVGEEHAPL